MSGAAMAVSLTTEQLEALVERSCAGVVAKLVAERQKEVLDLAECADLLKRSEFTVMNVLVKKRGLPVHFISEREPRFKRAEVMAWLDTLPRAATKAKAG